MGIMDVKLLSYTNNPIEIIYQAARTCYAQDINDIFKKTSKNSMIDFIQKIIKSGHHSVLEHVQLTFFIKDISRACSHQLVRHRVGTAFSQRSQKYTNSSNDIKNIPVPESIQSNKEALYIYNGVVKHIYDSYDYLIRLGIPKEDARYLLPNAALTSLTMSMNVRELIHFFNLRTCMRAQDEIREMAFGMIENIYRNDDLKWLFPYNIIGPHCLSGGICKEKNPCGYAYTTEDDYKYKNLFKLTNSEN